MKFSVPTIVMTVFMSFYTIVDGLFVSNLIGTDALSAVNLTAPVISLVTAISTMLATDGSAVIMRKVGAQKRQEANEDFTFLIVVNVVVGLLMASIGYLTMDSFFASMSWSPEVSEYCNIYLSRYLIFTIPILLMNNFTLYMIAAGKAALSMISSIAGGVLNMVLDYFLIAVFGLGIAGAAIATGLGYSVTAVVGIVIFFRKNSLLHFVRPVCRLKTLLSAATKRKFGNGNCAGDRHCYHDVQLDNAEICGGKRRCGDYYYYVCSDVRNLSVYRLLLRCCADDKFLLRRTES